MLPRDIAAWWKRAVGSSAARAYLLTFFTEAAGLVSTLVAFRLAAHRFGLAGFSDYAIARRAVAILSFTLLLGLGLALVRYIAAVAAHDSGEARARTYATAAVLIAAIPLTLFSLTALLLPGWLTEIFFGHPVEGGTTALTGAVIGMNAHAIVYSCCRGRFNMRAANVLAFINVSVIPVVSVLIASTAARAVLTIGVAMTITSACAWHILSLGRKDATRMELRAHMWELFRFGGVRTFGELAWFALLSIPVFVASHRFGLHAAGYFAFVLSLVSAATSIFASAGLILMPLLSRWLEEGNLEKTRKAVVAVGLLGTPAAGLIALALQLGLPTASALMLGHDFKQFEHAGRLLLLTIVPSAVYILLRQALDAAAIWPHNSVNLSAAAILLAILLYFSSAATMAAAAVLAAFTTLAGLTVFSCARVLRIRGAAASNPATIGAL